MQIVTITKCLKPYIDVRKGARMTDLEKDLYKLKMQSQVFMHNYLNFFYYLYTDIFAGLDFEIVVYDEIETFKAYDHPRINYSYPFDIRKTKV